MKKTLFAFLIGGLALSLAGSALAATALSFSPATVNVKENESFSLTVKVDPQGIKNYTVKLELSYPADLLKVDSFNFGGGWMAIPQPGYDLIDNTNGLLVKTGGYPVGLDSVANFGTISFSAKKAGSGTIKTTGNSMALDSQNSNLLSGNPQASVTIEKKVQVVTPKVTGEVKKTVPEPKETISEEEEAVEETVVEEEVVVAEDITEEPEKTSLLAAIGGIVSLGTDSVAVGIIVSLILVIILFFIIRKIFIKKKSV
jgi:hypothetical protein